MAGSPSLAASISAGLERGAAAIVALSGDREAEQPAASTLDEAVLAIEVAEAQALFVASLVNAHAPVWTPPPPLPPSGLLHSQCPKRNSVRALPLRPVLRLQAARTLAADEALVGKVLSIVSSAKVSTAAQFVRVGHPFRASSQRRPTPAIERLRCQDIAPPAEGLCGGRRPSSDVPAACASAAAPTRAYGRAGTGSRLWRMRRISRRTGWAPPRRQLPSSAGRRCSTKLRPAQVPVPPRPGLAGHPCAR